MSLIPAALPPSFAGSVFHPERPLQLSITPTEHIEMHAAHCAGCRHSFSRSRRRRCHGASVTVRQLNGACAGRAGMVDERKGGAVLYFGAPHNEVFVLWPRSFAIEADLFVFSRSFAFPPFLLRVRELECD